MSTPFGTTPTFTLTFTDTNLDLTTASHVYVTFQSGINKVTKSDSALTIAAKTIDVPLTQAETLLLIQNPNADEVTPVDVQANWTYTGGDRAGSEVVTYPFSRQLLPEVVN